MTLITRLLLSFTSSALLSVSYCLPEFGMLSFVALTPLMVAIANTSTRLRTGLYFIAMLVFALVVYWLMPQMLLEKATDNSAIAYFGYLLFAIWQTLPFVLFAFLTGRFDNYFQDWKLFKYATLITVLSHYHWSPLPLTLSNHLEVPLYFLQTLDLGGLPFNDFLLFLINFSFADAIIQLKNKNEAGARNPIIYACGIFIAMFLYGALTTNYYSTANSNQEKATNIGIVHTAFNYRVNQRSELARLKTLSEQLLNAETKPELIIWPELPSPPRQKADAMFLITMRQLQAKNNIDILAHNLDFSAKIDPANNRPYRFNLVSLMEKGKIIAQHKKQLLLPLVEYLPLENILRGLFPKPASYIPGNGSDLLSINKKVLLAPLICYESDFPEYSNNAVDKGANLLVNVVNDSWSMSDLNARKHFRQSQMRAIEMRKPIVRVSNNGFSGAIKMSGEAEFVGQPGEFQSSLVNVQPNQIKTLYARCGDQLFYALLLLVLVFRASFSYLPLSRNKKDRVHSGEIGVD